MKFPLFHSTANSWLMTAGIFVLVVFWSRLGRRGQPRQGRHICRNAWQQFQAPSGAAYSADNSFSIFSAICSRNMPPRWGLKSFRFDCFKYVAPDGAWIGLSN
jgi:hypothetical protein